MTDKQPLPPTSAYVSLGEGRYLATELTRGPWDPKHQHGGPPSALLAHEIARSALPLELTHLARLTVNLLRPIPIGELHIAVDTAYAGRNAGHFEAVLSAGGKQVARATALVQRESNLAIPAALPGHPLPAAPRTVEESPAARFPFNKQWVGYPDLVEIRIAEGSYFKGPSAAWFRLCHPLLEDVALLAIERVAVAADSGNGISSVLDFKHYSFVNNDLTINLLREPKGEWICIDARTQLAAGGGGLAEARIFDEEGLIGRSTQSLMIRAREG